MKILLQLILTLVYVAIFCGQTEAVSPAGDERPNILLIIVCSLRADHLSVYGYERDTTPHLDRLAQESVLFLNAFSTSCWTTPGVTSIFTSLYPSTHGVNKYYTSKQLANRNLVTENVLNDLVVTLAEVLRAAGYHTAAFISNPHANSLFNLDQGFDEYYDEGVVHTKLSGIVNKEVFQWLEANHTTRFFLCLMYLDPHIAYMPYPSYALKFDRALPPMKDREEAEELFFKAKAAAMQKGPDAMENLKTLITLYDGEINYLDEQIGQLFDRFKSFGLYDDTLIIFTADHGETFMEHGALVHGGAPHDEKIRVPFIMKFPSQFGTTGGKLGDLTSTIDIMPTILDFMHLPGSDQSQGVSLMPLIKGEKLDRVNIFSEMFIDRKNSRHIVGVRTLSTKYIMYVVDVQGGPPEEFYDLLNDPGEKHNLLRKDGSLVNVALQENLGAARRTVIEYLESNRKLAQNLGQVEGREMPKELVDKLKSLGYLQ